MKIALDATGLPIAAAAGAPARFSTGARIMTVERA